MKHAALRWFVLALNLVAGTAAAVETQLWVSDSPPDYAKAETRGVMLGMDGALGLGPRARSSAADSLPVIWAIAPLPDGSVALAGDGGRIDRWTESDGVRPWVRVKAGQVLSLVADGDGLLAGTGPEGRVYRISARGDTSLFAATGERYVWGLAAMGRGVWVAATGTRGRLVRLDGASVRVLADTDEGNLVSILADGRGGVLAGGDSRGRIFWARADGNLATVYDASEDEIRALAWGSDGALYAAGLSSSATTDDDASGQSVSVQPARSAVAGGRATLYRILPDSSAAAVWSSPHPFIYALMAAPRAMADGAGGVLAATGHRAGLFLVNRPNAASQWLAVPQGQITALAQGRNGEVFAATSNPGVLWRIGPGLAERGEVLSAPLDARRFARFGRLAWRGEAGGGRVRLSTRSGNSDPPDTTWTPWAATRDGRAASPAARYLQWKLELEGGQPRIEAIEAAWREQNLPPRVEELLVAPQGLGFREGDLTPRTNPVTQTLPGGQRVEYSISNPSAKTLRDLPSWAQGLRTLQWKGSDPNGDPLRYRVEIQAEGAATWAPVEDDLEAASFTWDTHALPDGRYRVRVEADDAAGNAIGESLHGDAVSEPFTVDNTPPRVETLELRAEPGAIVVEGSAADAASILTRIEVALDEGDWRLVSPEGGFADAPTLRFRVRVAATAGHHTVGVRVVDAAGNTATRAGRVMVPTAR